MDLDKPITTQEDLQERINTALSDRLARERAKFADYDSLKTFRSEAESTMTQATARITDLEGQVGDLTGKLDAATAATAIEAERATVASTKGVPIRWVTGTDRESMEKTADQWLADAKAARRPGHVPTQGTGDPGAVLSPYEAAREAGLAEARKRFGQKQGA